MGKGEVMERKLMLLGLLRTGESHGYQLMEILDTHTGMSIDLKKPTAYRLLDEMMQDGWLDSHEEKEGKRPTRTVYSLTSEGESQFKNLLRTCLAQYQPAEFHHDIGLMFLGVLPQEEVLNLLEKRLSIMNEHRENLRSSVEAHGGSSILKHHLNHLNLDRSFIKDMLTDIEKEGVNLHD